MTAREVARAPPRTVAVDACPVCGAGEARELWTLRDRHHGVPGEYRYVRCGRCASVYQSPRVRSRDLGLCYPETYYTHRPVGTEGSGGGGRAVRDRVRAWIQWAVAGGPAPGPGGRLAGRLLARVRALRERAFFDLRDPLIPRGPNPGRALEIGPGAGWELDLLRRFGWDAEGVDFDPEAAAQARAASGGRVRVGDFLEVVGPEERFDLVYMSHVLEHLPEPRAAFCFLAERLSAGGRAVLAYPNAEGLGARLWGRRWYPWDPPRHLVLPSAAGVRGMAREAGLGATLRTSTRNAAFVCAATRILSEGPGGPIRIRPLDRLFAAAEALLVRVGAVEGEEATLLLEKPREAAS